MTVTAERVIQGRVLDVQGRPVQGAELRIRIIERAVDGEPDALSFLGPRQQQLSAFPASVVSAADGRFALRGVGRSLVVVADVDDPRFAMQHIVIETEDTVMPRGPAGRGGSRPPALRSPSRSRSFCHLPES